MEHNNNIEPAAVEQNEALEQPTVTEQTEVVSESIPTETEQVIAAVKAEHSETVTVPAEIPAAEIAVISEKPKKKGYLKMFISAVLSCCVVAGGLWAARTFLVPSPEAVIKKAAAATFAQQKQLSQKANDAVPAYLPLFEGSTYKDEQTNFKLNINSIEGVPYSRMISALLSGFELSGSSAVSTADNSTELSASIKYDGDEVIGAEAFLSPNLISVYSPEILNKAISLDPSTFAEDYRNSFFNRLYYYIDDDTLEEIQKSINNALTNRTSYTPESLEVMQKDMLDIMSGCFKNAQYGYYKDSKLYYVDLAGNHVKDSVLALLRYIYLDSPMAAEIERSLAPSFEEQGVESYQQYVDNMTAEMQTAIPDLPVSFQLDIENGLIRNANSVCVPIYKSVIQGFTFDMAFFDASTSVRFSADLVNEGEVISVMMDGVNKFENDTITTDIDIAVNSESINLVLPIDISLSSAGDFSCVGKLSYDEDRTDGSFDISLAGSVSMDGDTLIYDLDDCMINVGSDQDSIIGLYFGISGEKAPLSAAPIAPEEHIELLSITEDDMWELYDRCIADLRSVLFVLDDLFVGI